MSSSTDRLDELDRVGYDPTTGTYHNECNWEGSDSLCLTIVETVSAVTGQEPTEMETLYSVIDPDALESLLSTARGSNVQLSFAFAGCTVNVAGSGEVVVEPEE